MPCPCTSLAPRTSGNPFLGSPYFGFWVLSFCYAVASSRDMQARAVSASLCRTGTRKLQQCPKPLRKHLLDIIAMLKVVMAAVMLPSRQDDDDHVLMIMNILVDAVDGG